MHTVYIIYSPTTDQYHIGQAKNMQIELWRHNARAIKSTAEGKPWEVRFTKSFATRNEALSLEMRLRDKGRQVIEQFIETNVL